MGRPEPRCAGPVGSRASRIGAPPTAGRLHLRTGYPLPGRCPVGSLVCCVSAPSLGCLAGRCVIRSPESSTGPTDRPQRERPASPLPNSVRGAACAAWWCSGVGSPPLPPDQPNPFTGGSAASRLIRPEQLHARGGCLDRPRWHRVLGQAKPGRQPESPLVLRQSQGPVSSARAPNRVGAEPTMPLLALQPEQRSPADTRVTRCSPGAPADHPAAADRGRVAVSCSRAGVPARLARPVHRHRDEAAGRQPQPIDLCISGSPASEAESRATPKPCPAPGGRHQRPVGSSSGGRAAGDTTAGGGVRPARPWGALP